MSRSRQLAAVLLFAASASLASACGREGPTDVFGLIIADGTVRFVNLEGGFYSLETPDGRKFDPINLPPAYQHDGLSVHFTGKVRHDMVSIHMYGEIFEVIGVSSR